MWPYLRSYLVVFCLIFGVSLALNFSASGETLCMTETWCPDRKDAAVILALIFTLPFLIITAFFLHLLPHIAGWIWNHPQHAFSIPFFFMVLVPLVPLWIFPEEIPQLQKTLSYMAIAANGLCAVLTLIYASTFTEEERHRADKQNRPVGVLLLLGLFLCMGLTVASVVQS